MNGRLNLSTAFDGQKTVTEDLYFAPPFKVYSPFMTKRLGEIYLNVWLSRSIGR